ncbi:hypothetical protein IWQ62_003771 [Dispira parvispora]|uniref:Derlin n=1 Tax=Dispira parvispora TaxID=1520584 RepID=A0A9W8E1B7_9FUNG|nr:hypothetical protein IWQ62_003771 [Dispira parvispora]
MPSPLEQWYREVPIITRCYLTGLVGLTLAVHIGSVHELQLYYDFDLTFRRGQYWRLLTTFLYAGTFSLQWVFHTYFLIHYLRSLEEGSFRNRTADFLWFLLLSAVALLFCSPFVTMPFLASPLSLVIIYVWSRRNPHLMMNFLGLFTFRAPYLPLVMLGLGYLSHNYFPLASVAGVVIGHAYYFLEDIWPQHPASHQRRWLQTPAPFERLVSRLLNDQPIDRGLPVPPNDGDDVGNEAIVEPSEPVPSNSTPSNPSLRQRREPSTVSTSSTSD